MSTQTKFLISTVLIVAGVVLRLVPHPWNAAPITAIALLCGVYLGIQYALVVPLVAMLIGDAFIGGYTFPIMLAVYASFGVSGLLGAWLRPHRTPLAIGVVSILASTQFFLLTNLAVWQFSGMYAHTFVGLANCFVAFIKGSHFSTFKSVMAIRLFAAAS